MPRIRIASAAIATFVLLPACSAIIDTNPDGVIADVGGKGAAKGGKEGGGAPSGGGSATVGGTSAVVGGKAAGGTGGTVKPDAGSSAVANGEGGGLGQSGTPGASNGGAGGSVATSGGNTSGVVGGTTSTGTSGAATKGGATGSSGATGVGGAGGAGTATGGGALAIGGRTTGGVATTFGGATGVGGKATGGAVSAGGGAAIGGAATGGVAPTGGMPATGGSSQIVCTGTVNCSGKCVDLQTDRSNCGNCGTTCESYQFCSGGTCLPHYVSTKILATSDLAADAAKQVVSAAVQTNKASGDLLVQIRVTKASVTLSAPSEYLTQVSSNSTAVALARFTATGNLVWGRDLESALGSTTDQPINAGLITPFVLAANGDPVLAYYRYDPPPTGPALRTGRYWMARINGNNANPTWATSYAVGHDPRTIVARSAKNDFISFGPPPDGAGGSIWRIVDNGTSATATLVGTNYASGALPGSDGETVWLWGCGYAGTFAINPWSTQTFNITANPSQAAGTDAFILGAQDTGQSIGPWMSEGDWGPLYVVGMDASGDLIVAARSSGYTTFNGGQDFIPQAGQVLVKINHITGQIVWRTSLAVAPAQIIAVPGNRIATLTQQLDPITQMPIPNATYIISIYSTADGSLLSTILAGMMGQMVAAGTTDLFVLGVVSSAADFDPGAATDSRGSTPGVFISRYSF